MNDFENEADTVASETDRVESQTDSIEFETDAEVVASGLLPRESYRPDARLEVVDDERPACEARRIYEEVPIRIDDARSVLLVGPWCEIRSGRAYRVRKRGEETEPKALLTVEIVAGCDAEMRLHRV